MNQRFRSCGFSTVQPDEGRLIEYEIGNLEITRDVVFGKDLIQSTDKMRVVFDAIFNRMERTREYAPYSFVKFDLFHFRPETGFVEDDGRAKYEVFQIPLFRSGGFDYGYVVIDHVLPRPGDEEGTTIPGFYRLRGVSTPLQVATPEYDWCNSDWAWLYLSEEPADFNAGVPALQ